MLVRRLRIHSWQNRKSGVFYQGKSSFLFTMEINPHAATVAFYGLLLSACSATNSSSRAAATGHEEKDPVVTRFAPLQEFSSAEREPEEDGISFTRKGIGYMLGPVDRV